MNNNWMEIIIVLATEKNTPKKLFGNLLTVRSFEIGLCGLEVDHKI